MTTVIIHHTEDGETILCDDPAVTVLEIDERAPHDRVFRRRVEARTVARIAALIGDDAIGHAGDARHEAIRRRVAGETPVHLVTSEADNDHD